MLPIPSCHQNYDRAIRMQIPGPHLQIQLLEWLGQSLRICILTSAYPISMSSISQLVLEDQ